ncbi:MAG: hypothetical protein HY951_13180 [Bacteroidia bacterium]|nr:hypothetical protein [Bacteroidia bacterium]
MKKLFFLAFLLIVTAKVGFSQKVWTIGPMFHVNFGGEKIRGSFALEVAYWNLEHFPYSFDGGIEFESKKIRFYSEIQTGILVAGLSVGPLLQINTNEGSAHFGIQTSVWANYFIGFDYRKRWVNKEKLNCFGVYAKLPVAHSGFSESNSNSNYDSWDWD